MIVWLLVDIDDADNHAYLPGGSYTDIIYQICNLVFVFVPANFSHE